MTRADDIRAQVQALDDNGIPASHIAHALGIPVDRVERILDSLDPPHPERETAPILEPLGGPAVINSQAAVAGGSRDAVKDALAKQGPKRQPVGSKPGTQRGRSAPKLREGYTPRHLIECGTRQGYYLHRRNKTTTCQPCRDAYNAYSAARYGRKRAPIVCGTYRGWKRHHRAKEKPCEECRVAYNEAAKEWRKNPAAVPVGPWVHGTPEGYQRHRRNKELACDECAPHGQTQYETTHQERLALYQQGMTDNQIAAQVGVSRYVIARWRARRGLPVNPDKKGPS